jgi:hypothetical protein
MIAIGLSLYPMIARLIEPYDVCSASWKRIINILSSTAVKTFNWLLHRLPNALMPCRCCHTWANASYTILSRGCAAAAGAAP